MSNNTQHKVVVTGYGAWTCLGKDAAETWQAMRDGRSGITHLDLAEYTQHTDGDAERWTTRIAGTCVERDYSHIADKREARRLDRSALIGLVAAQEAVDHSGVDFPKENTERCGVVIGSGIGGISTIEESVKTLVSRGPERVSPFTVPRLMVNATAGNASIRFGLKGPASAHATACASSGHAIGDAVSYIRNGLADVMLAGGAEAAVTPLCVASFASMKALSTRNDEPEKASRPFDQGRDGFIMAEGAAVLILESEAHAKARGATIHAEILGYGNSADAHHITAPDPAGSGASRSMRAALADAGLSTDQIDYINAHGTSTPLGDKAEVEAVTALFGDHARQSAGGKLLMSSTKSVHGHALGASGAIESIASIHAVRDGIVAPTINLENPDEGFDIDLVPHEARRIPVNATMNNTFGFGGHNVTLIFGRYQG